MVLFGFDKITYYASKPMEVYSSIVGRLSDLRAPQPFLTPFLKLYSRCYHVNRSELPKPIREYSSFREFFTRPMKEGSRIVDPRPETVVSPVDGMVLEAGKTDTPVPNTFRIKDRYYTLEELLGRMSYYDFSNEGMTGFYTLFYLPPGAYHRIHAPFSGNVSRVSFSPGTVYPVNQIGRRLVPDYHVKNARAVLKLRSPDGGLHAFLVLIGALVVGGITLTYNGRRELMARDDEFLESLEPPVFVEKGSEVGLFNLGSAVLLICYGPREAEMRLAASEGGITMGTPVMESEILRSGKEHG
jgi:phosphatidylserine decarboxylase